MGIRLTGISTPVGGLSWEYTQAKEQKAPTAVIPGQKIKVFISSICGVEKYDKVRAELKNAIENTQLADAYTFEGEGASIGGITDETKNHIVSKCKHDANYVVRTVCSEVETEKQA